MKVQVREADDVVIVDLAGRLAAGSGDRLLREVLDELLGEGWDKILLNLSEVTSVDSSGIGELVAGLRLARRLDSTLKVLNLQERVERTLRIGQMLPLFEVYRDEEEALASFGES
jgi:anti-sigma B factor antagonist